LTRVAKLGDAVGFHPQPVSLQVESQVQQEQFDIVLSERMFESAELGHRVTDRQYDRAEPRLARGAA